MWEYRGQQRPPFAVEPEPGQESVWDYPRPPILVPSHRRVRVLDGQRTVASSDRALRLLETASPPTYYLPPSDVDLTQLSKVRGSSFCEWKGAASYWALATSPGDAVGWSYPDPASPYEALEDYLSFYPGRIECWVGDERVAPQPGHFYGGWVTSDIVGPVKGDPGTGHW